MVNLFGAPEFFTDDYLKDKQLISPNEIDWQNFAEYGFYRLSDIVENVKDATPDKKIDFKYEEIVKKLVSEMNVAVIDAMKGQLGDEYKDSVDYEKLRQELLRVLDSNDAKAVAMDVEKKSIATELPSSGIVLQHADVLEHFTNTVNKVSEKMLLLRGGVVVVIEDTIIRANEVLINLDKKEIYAKDNLSVVKKADFLQGDRMYYHYEKERGYIGNPRGLLEGRYFKGRMMTINNKDYFTLYEGSLAFSNNLDPYYTIYTDVFDSFGQEKWTAKNLQVRVGNNTFFWLPAYIGYPFTTGINLKFGENRREGFYALSSVDFLDSPLKKISLEFDVYEKLGVYSSVENSNTHSWIKYSFLLALAAYTDNFLVRNKPEKLTYTHNNTPYINSDSYLRHKFKYDQSIFLHKAETIFGVKEGTAESLNISTSLDANIYNVSDPFITHNYRNKDDFTHLDWGKIVERHDRDEDEYRHSPKDKNKYSLAYNLTVPSVSFSTSVSWVYDVYKNLDKDEDDPIDQQYKMYLKNVVLPSINFRHAGAMDRRPASKEKRSRPFYLDLGYSLYLGYSSTDSYKDGKFSGSSTGITKDIEPYEFIKKNSDFNIGADIFRKFVFSSQDESIVKIPLEWFYFHVYPKFSLKYFNALVPVDNTSSNNNKKNRGDLKFDFNLGVELAFFSLIEYPLEVILTQDVSLSDVRTFFYIGPEVDKEKLDFKERQVQVNYHFASNTTLNFPSSVLKAKWAESYSYLSMLPTGMLKLGYEQALYTSPDWTEIKEGTAKYAFNRFKKREIFLETAMEQKGYGLFYLPHLDYVLKNSLKVVYDLNPELFKANIDDKDISKNFILDRDEFWKERRFKSFDGSTAFSLSYHFVEIKESIFYNFFDKSMNKIKPSAKNNKLDFLLKYDRDKKKGNPWFNMSQFSFIYTWNYYFLEKDYLSDSMNITLSTEFDIFTDFFINFSVKVSNPKSYLYFKKKADFLKFPHVNFFEDIKKSMGFAGIKGQQQGLFKFSEFRAFIYHNIDDWFLRFGYVLSTENFSESSYQGYYFDHKVEFEVNLKPEVDPREGENKPFFQKVEKSFNPNIINKNTISK